MFYRTIQDPVFGLVRRSWGKWKFKAPSLSGDGVLTVFIEIPRHEAVEPYLNLAKLVLTRIPEFKERIAPQLFADYRFHKQVDLTDGRFSEADYERFPRVTGPGDIWTVLKPWRFRVGPCISKDLGNAYLLVDVCWPNRHLFQVFLELGLDSFKYMHTELVG